MRLFLSPGSLQVFLKLFELSVKGRKKLLKNHVS